MSESRREFLKLLSLASAGIAVNPLTPVLANNEVYVNKALGIAFRIPADWHFYNVQQIQEMVGRQKGKEDSYLFERAKREFLNQPLVSFGMHPYDEHEPEKVFSPSVVLMLEEREDGEDLLHNNLFYGNWFLVEANTVLESMWPKWPECPNK